MVRNALCGRIVLCVTERFAIRHGRSPGLLYKGTDMTSSNCTCRVDPARQPLELSCSGGSDFGQTRVASFLTPLLVFNFATANYVCNERQYTNTMM